MIEESGSVRVDLLGGTIDLNPINLIIPNVVTLNVATSLKAKVKLEATSDNKVTIVSKDYNSTSTFNKEEFTKENFDNNHFKELTFVCLILDHFDLNSNIKLTLESGSPPGGGLGGSSAMGVTIYKALTKYTKTMFDPMTAFKVVNGIEGKILDSGPAGYQDYFPALFGGVLALLPHFEKIEVTQLYSKELKSYLESHLTLVNSGENRHSGINNWEVYKAFFDKDPKVRQGLTKIAELSHKAFFAIQDKEFESLCSLISQEGEERTKLFPGILSPGMKNLYNSLEKSLSHVGIKVCGAGGGGCFILVHEPEDKEVIQKAVADSGMTELEFSIEEPLS